VREDLSPREVRPSRLGCVGPLEGYLHAKDGMTFEVEPGRGELKAQIPCVVEAWARKAGRPSVQVCVNRTPVTAEVRAWRDGKQGTDYVISGCNLGYRFTVGRDHDFDFLVNVLAPYLPRTTDGKEPDLEPIWDCLLGVLEKAARCARSRAGGRGAGRPTIKQVVLDTLDGAIAEVSGGGKSRYGQRTLFYRQRPEVQRATGEDLKWGTYCKIIREYEDEVLRHDLRGITRDNRGMLYHPHTGEMIPLGTLSVEQYRRPALLFNKLVYCEKEGFITIMVDAGWPERHDCALVTSKGYATRAVADVLNLLGESDEPLIILCVHDADGPGTCIYQALQRLVDSRPGWRARVRVVNLGLEPWEGLDMGLRPERVILKRKRVVPVADYVPDEWWEWLQTQRVELNAMTTPQFLGWMDGKLAPYDGKLIPPEPVLAEALASAVRGKLKDAITARVLREADIESQFEEAYRRLAPAVGGHAGALGSHVKDALEEAQGDPWTKPIDRLADEIIGG
jgi:hypothetical protein